MTVLGKLAFTAVPLALLPEIPAVAAGPARQGKAGVPVGGKGDGKTGTDS